jgi:glutamyl-Q tRNA(Asp) synthetase
MSSQTNYRGRFAPSPTGALHFGSLIAATASYLQAKHQKGQWLLRIDDIDPPREQKGAADKILKTLEGFGFEWDEEVYYQSKRRNDYQEAVNDLIKQQYAYPCSCSRKSILKDTGQQQNQGNIIYPGFCRNEPRVKSESYSIRLQCSDKPMRFNDIIQGQQETNLNKSVGDFILQRRDGCFSYHLASGIDDAEQKITEVVRGADLLNSTFCQLHVQHMLNIPSPHYCHLPIIVDNKGQKLSKQSHAAPINIRDSVQLLYKTLKFLGQMPPIHLIEANQKDIWCWAKKHWQLNLVPQKLENTIDSN